MSYFAAADYMSQKRTEFANARADAYWSTPHPSESGSGVGVVRSLIVALARLI